MNQIRMKSPYSSLYTLHTNNRTSGGSYPWMGGIGVPRRVPAGNRRQHERQRILAVRPRNAPRFGKKRFVDQRHRKKTAAGWCVVRGRVKQVYRFKGLAGRRYYDLKKVPKGKKCFKLKSKAMKFLSKQTKPRKGTTRRRTTRKGTRKGKNINKQTFSYSTKHKSKRSCENAGYYWNGKTCMPVYFKKRSRFGAVNPTNRFNYRTYQYANNLGTPTERQLRRISGTPAYAYPLASGPRSGRNYRYRLLPSSGYGF